MCNSLLVPVEVSCKAHSLVFVHQLLVVQISQSSSQHAVDALAAKL